MSAIDARGSLEFWIPDDFLITRDECEVKVSDLTDEDILDLADMVEAWLFSLCDRARMH